MVSCSVVLATYNGAAYLPAQLESIGAQVRLPDELIVSDDGSTDGTLEIVEDFARRAPFTVKVLQGPGCGCAENFWQAAKVAKGDFLAWCDQDDVWHPQKLARCTEALTRYHASMVVHTAAVVGPRLEPLGRRYPDYAKLRVLGPLQGDPLHVPSGFATVFRRELADEVEWEGRPLSHQHRHPLPHDHVISLEAFARHRRVELPDVLAEYRQHGANLAGAPKATTTLGVMKEALATSAAQFRQLSDRARGYADWFERAGATEAASYFRLVARKAMLRGDLREEARIGRRWGLFGGALKAGSYRPVDQGGFGSAALANDLLLLSVASGSEAASRLRKGRV